MAGALTLFFLLAVSLTIVRAAGVALRVTGVPQPIARFQAVSALTGAGYTTLESETLMRHPVRRRILMILMLTGHLGLVSLASTVIVAVAAADGIGGATAQIAALLASVGAVYALAASSKLDEAMCEMIRRMMQRWNWLAEADATTIYVHGSGKEVTEHVVTENVAISAASIPVHLLAADNLVNPPNDEVRLSRGDTVLCFGTPEDQKAFADLLRSGTCER